MFPPPRDCEPMGSQVCHSYTVLLILDIMFYIYIRKGVVSYFTRRLRSYKFPNITPGFSQTTAVPIAKSCTRFVPVPSLAITPLTLMDFGSSS